MKIHQSRLSDASRPARIASLFGGATEIELVVVGLSAITLAQIDGPRGRTTYRAPRLPPVLSHRSPDLP